ncbi:hypothetical protein ACFFX0_04810 [Citricoccus parietis]|uniref:Uncharacterized protein n=1 Tax=Citricoccus parietis TaxID=592307 RepID=A0ABV5FV34_9MICC
MQAGGALVAAPADPPLGPSGREPHPSAVAAGAGPGEGRPAHSGR